MLKREKTGLKCLPTSPIRVTIDGLLRHKRTDGETLVSAKWKYCFLFLFGVSVFLIRHLRWEAFTFFFQYGIETGYFLREFFRQIIFFADILF